MVAEDYVHRIGRTGRNGSTGEAVSLVSLEDAKLLRAIVRLLNRDREIKDVPGFVPQTPIRWGNSAPGRADQPGGDRPPRRHDRRPHGEAPRRAHAGPKQHGAPRPGGNGNGRRAGGGGAGAGTGGQRSSQPRRAD
jgi:ATP-dependent RNA helicase RhlE